MTVLQRRDRGTPLTKASWWLNQDAEISVSCPQCGGIGNLNGHQVTLIGTGHGLVEPSLQCDCGFHDDVALRDWSLPLANPPTGPWGMDSPP